jgi:hypothetical protein
MRPRRFSAIACRNLAPHFKHEVELRGVTAASLTNRYLSDIRCPHDAFGL